MYIALYFTAPFIAEFYNKAVITEILRIMSLTLFLGAYNSVQMAYAAKEFKFQLIFLSSIASIVISGALGIIFSFKGYGLWALVIQQISSSFVTVLVMSLTIRWRPKLKFSLNRVKSLVSYGWKIMMSELIDISYTELFNLIVGKKYSTHTLGYYNKGQQLPKQIARNITSSVTAVMLPVYSAFQDDKINLKKTVRRAITLGSFITFPFMIGLAALADTLIEAIYTVKWIESVPFLRIFCLTFLFYPVNVANTQAINGIGRSDIFLRINIIKKLIGIAILLFTFRISVYAMVWDASRKYI